MKIIPYQNEYRDDMIFCLLSAKDALGRVPRINEDLFDIQKNYFDKGNMFWLAIDDNNRVVGMIGANIVLSDEVLLRRLYVKPNLKRSAIGSKLLETAVEFAKSKGISTIHTRFSIDYTEAMEFYLAKGFVEVGFENGIYHFIKTLK